MLSKKFDFNDREQALQQYWADHQVYKFNKEASGQVYSIDTPPPTVSGNIHIGHISSYTQAEIIARYHRMIGENVFYPFGFDDNGLPTERLVERDLKIIAKDMVREEFIDQCLTSTKTYENDFKALWESMGFSCDRDLTYRTIDERSQSISQRSFLELAHAGKAYIDESPVLWCSECQTSIAQAELESKEKDTKFITLIFDAEGEKLKIATTRPEMLYACVAIMVHPEDERYQHLVGTNVRVPLYEFDVPLIADDKVTMDKGTGVVMCCTFGDITDMEWYKLYQLPYKKMMEVDGHILESVPHIGGMYVTKARKTIIDLLENQGFIENVESISHTVSVHERCGRPVEIIPSKQWYIDILTNKDKYLQAADQINWYPKHMKKRYVTWVENLKWNWCVSRQRYYGVPIPVWYCRECEATIYPSYEDLPINPMTSKPKKDCVCGCNDFIGETAVLDTWATSSVTPQINNHWHETDERGFMPMGLRTQAHEIIRTWAFYTIVKSVEHHQDIPWKDIMISGFVLAKKGEKISKSKNNASLSPSMLIKEHSADAIRYWVASARLGTDTMFDPNELKLSKRFLNKLWNASKFSLMMLDDFEGPDLTKVKDYDQWIIDKYHYTLTKVMEFLNQYEVGLARQVIDDFFWKDFCDNYLEYVKDRLYKTELYTKERVASGRQALYYTMLGILKMYSIFTPHMTEEIYLSFFKGFEEKLSIHQLQWDEGHDYQIELCETIKEILFEVRKYKSARNLSMKEKLEKITISSQEGKMLENCLHDLKACCHCDHIEIINASDLSVSIEG